MPAAERRSLGACSLTANGICLHARYTESGENVSPTVLRVGSLRFFFFSREETRLHVHVQSPEGEAKFWLDPDIALADNVGISATTLKRVERLVRKHELEIRKAWREHFHG